jgi:hypothetical protein
MFRIRTFLLWASVVAAHTYLFYKNSTGINALIFSILIVAVITWYHGMQKERFWWLAVTGHLIISVGTALHGSWNDVAAYNISFLLLAGFVFSAKSSLPVAFINGVIGSFFIGFLTTLLKGSKVILQRPGNSGKSFFRLKNIPLYVAPVCVTVVFYLLYGISNPDFIPNIELMDIGINMELIAYCVFGAILTCPLFFSWGIDFITAWELKQPDILHRMRVKRQSGTPLGLFYEHKQAVIMFVMLNVLLVIFLLFNVVQLFIPTLNHSAAHLSDEVHRGFETLVISLIVAILLIMYYFRANQNFYFRNKQLIKVASFWIILNALLILLTCYKNGMYVHSFGLTYKRIWVFMGMLLTGIGLYLTWVKIYRLKTNWFLIRKNTWVLYFAIACYGLIDWDRLITHYNLNYTNNLDMKYILSLDKTKLPYLNELLDAQDPRVMPYEKEIREETSRFKGVTSWQEKTWTNSWMEKELAIK